MHTDLSIKINFRIFVEPNHKVIFKLLELLKWIAERFGILILTAFILLPWGVKAKDTNMLTEEKAELKSVAEIKPVFIEVTDPKALKEAIINAGGLNKVKFRTVEVMAFIDLEGVKEIANLLEKRGLDVKTHVFKFTIAQNYAKAARAKLEGEKAERETMIMLEKNK